MGEARDFSMLIHESGMKKKFMIGVRKGSAYFMLKFKFTYRAPITYDVYEMLSILSAYSDALFANISGSPASSRLQPWLVYKVSHIL
jgi:hypothetical protein